ncbi:MFS transporter [Frisingicoccus sp.]|uniref:MFS transporter n=1 Tax=Frisingicoccus sp. TaxID=1918627 RepID=UPI003AB61F2F
MKKIGWNQSAWCTIIGGFIIMSLMHSMTKTCFSLYMIPVTEELGTSRMSYSLCTGIFSVVIAILSPYAGRLLSKYETMKWFFPISVAGMSIAYSSFGLAKNIYQMYFASLILGIFNTGAVIMPISIILVKCCDNYIGLAIGIAFAGSGIGGALTTPILTRGIEHYGWHAAFFAVGVIMLIIEVPVSVLMCRAVKKRERELVQIEKDNESAKSLYIDKGIPLKKLKKHTFFYIYLLGMLTCLFIASGGHSHLAPYMSETYGLVFSNAIASFFLMMLTPAKVILSWLYDRLDMMITNIGMLVSFAVAYLLLEINAGWGMMWIMAIFFSIGVSSGSIVPSIVTVKLFGKEYYGEVFGYVYRFCMLGSVLGSPVLAWIYDATGTYHLAWMTCFMLCLLTAVCLCYAEVSFIQLKKDHSLEQILKEKMLKK